MCGIVGYAGWREAQALLLECLRRLEYRGYDSAGLAIVAPPLQVKKSQGEIRILESQLPRFSGTTGLAHTRWATHGRPSEANAHPLLDCKGQIAVVHNGIISNYHKLREGLKARGHRFVSETDTEVVPHLVEEHYHGDLLEAVRAVLPQLEGTYALGVVGPKNGEVIGARREAPLVVGVGTGEQFLASDITALLRHTDRMLVIRDGELVRLTPQRAEIFAPDGSPVERSPEVVRWSVEDAERGGFEHFMLKEIFEQPRAVHESLLSALDEAEYEASPVGNFPFLSVKLVACGSSFHAALAGKYIFEQLAKVPSSAEIASEYRYSAASMESPLTVLISQSGETADTVAAAREARRRGCHTLGITNVVGSALEREVNTTLYTRAGPEIGVAATKTFATQLVALYGLARQLGLRSGGLSPEAARSLAGDLRALPRLVQAVLNRAESIAALAERYREAKDIFFIGRNLHYPIALEGALKLKEISYVHGEGYPAGELKHGPLALLTEETPVVALCSPDHTYERLLGNIGEVSARGSPVLAVALDGDAEIEKFADAVLRIPDVAPIFAPIPMIVALQLFAYYSAKLRGCPIDKPRNIAKTVTVE